MPSYMYFFLAVVSLIVGYVIYGTLVEKIFGVRDDRKTPVRTFSDGVDYVHISKWRLFLIQVLNIAGLGPIFGPILGALYGWSALLWIVIGCIFAGAVHDYFSGMLSVRYKGKSSPEIIGYILGKPMLLLARIFMVILLVLIGTVFVAGPADIMADVTETSVMPWLVVIFAYFVLATLMPMDKIIGKIYPFFGAFLIFMALGLIIALFFSNHTIYEPKFFEDFKGSPNGLPIWPMVFITIACGAISGFHCTQSTIVARCLGKESEGRMVFYGAMITEGIIALIWATLGMSFYQSPAELYTALSAGGSPAFAVKDISVGLLGFWGGLIALIGVVILPITSGDTALRSARLAIADALNLEQKYIRKRLYIALPIFIAVIVLTFVDFGVVWRYFGWVNQIMAAAMLWTAAAWLYRNNKFHWICSIPATFMTAVTVSYICCEKTMGLGLTQTISNAIAITSSLMLLLFFLCKGKKKKQSS